jgi:hypothetical protein
MLTHVFIRTQRYGENFLRVAMLSTVRERWLMEKVIVTELYEPSPNRARAAAEERAESDPYIFTDDDVLIVGKDWVSRALEVFQRHPEYGVVSTLSLVESENLAIPGSISGNGDEKLMEIYPMHAVGQPMFVRKGISVDMPEFTLDQECFALQRLCEAKGMHTGLFHPNLRIRHNHMGHGFSSNPVLAWSL